MRALREATAEDGAAERTLKTAVGDRSAVVRQAVAQSPARRRREQPLRGAMGPPVRAQPRQDWGRERNVAILFAFAVDMHHHPRAVDIGDLQARPFEQPESAGINGRQTHAVHRNPHRREHAADLLPTQHHRHLVLAGGTHESERRPLPTERLLEEEPNPAQRDRRRRARDLLLVGQVQEVLAQVLLGQLVWAPVIVLRELAHGRRVALLRSCGEPPELHILQHPST